MLSSIVLINSHECPKPELLKPCFCNADGISCGGNQTIDLKTIFHGLSSTLEEGKKHFRQFSLNNTALSELLENTFGNITFDHILIKEAKNLTRFQTNTFIGINQSIKEFDLYTTPLNNYPPNYDIFTAFSSMNNLEVLNIMYTNLEEIPENAFRPLNGLQNNLSTIYLYNNKISKIGNNAFKYLNSLTELHLTSNFVDNIPENAFSFSDTSEKRLNIFLIACHLKSVSFSVGAFSHLNRPTRLYLDAWLNESNNITFLDQRIFEPFFNANNRNEIQASNLDCDDCRSYWLVKDNRFSQQLTKIYCSDSKQVSDNKNFANCIHLF
jgi:hypothetical protein